MPHCQVCLRALHAPIHQFADPQHRTDGFLGVGHAGIIDIGIVIVLHAYAVAGIVYIDQTLLVFAALALNTCPCLLQHGFIELYIAHIQADGGGKGVGKHRAAGGIRPVIGIVDLIHDLIKQAVFLALELGKRIQNLRKSSGFDVVDKVDVVIYADGEDGAEIEASLANFRDYVAAQTLALSVECASMSEAGEAPEVEWNEEMIRISVTRKQA